jgi:hypothetical protein
MGKIMLFFIQLQEKTGLNYGTMPLHETAQQPAPQPVTWRQRLVNYVSNWSLPRKVVTVAVAVGIFAAAGVAIRFIPHHGIQCDQFDLSNATSVCNLVPYIGSHYLNCTHLPILHTLATNITNIYTQFCGATAVTNPVVIQAANRTLDALQENFANQTAYCVTGEVYPPSMIAQMAYNLMYYPLTKLGSHVISGWTAMTSYGVSLPAMRIGSFACLTNVCGYMTQMVPVFDGATYTCASLQSLASKAITQLANSNQVWPCIDFKAGQSS